MNDRICCCGTGLPSIDGMMVLQNNRERSEAINHERQSRYNSLNGKQSQRDNQEAFTFRIFGIIRYDGLWVKKPKETTGTGVIR